MERFEEGLFPILFVDLAVGMVPPPRTRLLSRTRVYMERQNSGASVSRQMHKGRRLVGRYCRTQASASSSTGAIDLPPTSLRNRPRAQSLSTSTFKFVGVRQFSGSRLRNQISHAFTSGG